jgi:choline-sulfatase
VSNLDWFPTLLEIAGVAVPTDQPVRGRSILPLLKGGVISDWPEDFYGEYSTKHQSRTHMRCYRSPYYKLVRDFLNPGRDEFYNLVKDPEEQVNLIESDDAEIRQIIAEFDGKIRGRMREVGDPVLDNPGVAP